MFGLGRLSHLAFDLIAITTILAGVKKSTGFVPHLGLITEPSIRSFFQKYLSVGDQIFGMLCGLIVNSGYFKRSIEP